MVTIVSGECETCDEHTLDCICDNYQCPPPIRSYDARVIVKNQVDIKFDEKKIKEFL